MKWILFLCLSLWATDSASLLKKAEEAEASENYETALMHLEDALDSNSFEEEIRLRLVDYYLLFDLPEDALQNEKRLRELQIESSQSQRNTTNKNDSKLTWMGWVSTGIDYDASSYDTTSDRTLTYIQEAGIWGLWNSNSLLLNVQWQDIVEISNSDSLSVDYSALLYYGWASRYLELTLGGSLGSKTTKYDVNGDSTKYFQKGITAKAAWVNWKTEELRSKLKLEGNWNQNFYRNIGLREQIRWKKKDATLGFSLAAFYQKDLYGAYSYYDLSGKATVDDLETYLNSNTLSDNDLKERKLSYAYLDLDFSWDQEWSDSWETEISIGSKLTQYSDFDLDSKHSDSLVQRYCVDGSCGATVGAANTPTDVNQKPFIHKLDWGAAVTYYFTEDFALSLEYSDQLSSAISSRDLTHSPQDGKRITSFSSQLEYSF